MRALCTGGSWQHRCGFRSLARTGGSCVKEFKDLLYSMQTTGAPRQGSQLNQVVVLQHSLTAPEVLHLHRLRQSERFEDSKMQRCRATWTRGSNASMQQNHATQPIQRRCSSTITTSRRAGRSQLSTTACASRRTSVVDMAPRRQWRRDRIA